ncbi:putative protein RSN1 [Rhizoctonia solani]|uniref:Uncharacterized protein n=1 Tax=Rhizoctonia solani TaxID=456999 RepID=A0A0K6GDA6_9AGAM|nr:putative protein RSN1 [Rhizoctonia solani]
MIATTQASSASTLSFVTPRTKLSCDLWAEESITIQERPLGDGRLSSLVTIFKHNHEDIRIHNRMDSCFFVWFLQIVVRVFVPFWLISRVIILSVDAAWANNKDSLNHFTFGNIAGNFQNRFAAHLIFARFDASCSSFDTQNNGLKDLPDIYDRRTAASNKLEGAEFKLAAIAQKLNHKRTVAIANAAKKGQDITTVAPPVLDSDLENVAVADRYVPRSERPTHRLAPFKWFPLALPFMGGKLDTIEWARKQVIESDQLLTEGCRKLAEDRANVGVDMDENYPPLNSVFILFNQQIGAHIVAQILVHNQPYRMAEKYTEVAPADVIWGNLGINPYEARIRKAISYATTPAYSIIPPIMNDLVFVAFFLFYLVWKYLFLWGFGRHEAGDTEGRYGFITFYLALHRTDLSVLFFVSRDLEQRASATLQGVLMTLLIIITPLTAEQPAKIDKLELERAEHEIHARTVSLKAGVHGKNAAGEGKHNDAPEEYTHPAAIESQRIVWLPSDLSGVAEAEEMDLTQQGIDLSTKNAAMDKNGHVESTGPPPGGGDDVLFGRPALYFSRCVYYPEEFLEDHRYFGVPALDEGHRQQLVHKTSFLDKPSRMVQFAARLGLAKGNKSVMNAMESAYSFLSENYQPGDQVILYVRSFEIGSDLDLKAAESLAKHLHDGTRPGDRCESQRSSGNNKSPGKIPIHGIVVSLGGEMRQMCEVNDGLKSRFPPGIEHIVCCTYDAGDRSCATRFDMTGAIVWREICISPDRGWDLWIHCTKHVLYWEENWILKWDKRDPVWTQELDSSPGSAPDGLGLGLTKPVGMYRHELRKYRRYLWEDIFMLVWKSCRGVDQSLS